MFFHSIPGKKCLLLLLLLKERALILSLDCSVVTLFPAELSELNNDPLFPNVHCKLEVLLYRMYNVKSALDLII